MIKKSILALASGLAWGYCHAQSPVCTLSSNKSILGPNEVLILTAACTPAATSYIWTGPGIPSVTAVPSVLGTTPSTAGVYDFAVAGVNSTGRGQSAGTSITIGTTLPPPPPPPPSGPANPPPLPAPTLPVLTTCATNYVEPTNLTKGAIALNGEPVDIALMSGKIYALKFTPRSDLKVARVEMLSDSYIDGKDVSISPCAGDFSSRLPGPCVSPLMGSTMLMLDFDSSIANLRCHLAPGYSYYLNVKMSYPTAASFVKLSAREFR